MMAVPTLKRCLGQLRNRQHHSAKHPQRRKAIGALVHAPLFPTASHVGTVQVQDPETRRDYTVEVWIHSGVMVVSHATDKRWLLELDEILDLAIAAGIDRGAD
ncbi:hypothetical protein D7Y57_06005 [Stenotrophomonas maltophilia]|nr:hypothetical protein DF40_004775 [Stenotrophomonas maltophilia M30]MBA0455694.1 hypothetical protein [Stenotrophomonas maltophilia]